MPTRDIVPRGDGEGSVGTSEKNWGAVWAKKLNNVDVGDLIANKDDYRQPNTTYTVGTIKYHHSLPTGYYLECTTAGITGSGDLSVGTPDVYDTLTDGTVTWTVCKYQLDFPRYGAFNTKETFTTSGSFTAPVSGTYRITLQGGGGGGGTVVSNGRGYVPGGGGGQGGHYEFYEKLTAGTSYPFTIGAGGSQSTSGGASSITINGNEYICNGGGAGMSGDEGQGGLGGSVTVNNVEVSRGMSGTGGVTLGYGASGGTALTNAGGTGGGTGGGKGTASNGYAGVFGGGGGGAGWYQSAKAGGAGGNGYITFEYCNV